MAKPDQTYSLPAAPPWPWVAAGLVLLAATVLLSPLDLPVARVLYGLWPDFGSLVQRHGTKPSSVFIIAAMAVLIIPRLRQGCVTCSLAASAVIMQALLHMLLVTNALKFLWGRPRFVNLHADFHDFSPLWSLNPCTGDVSFPSGHVAAALVTLPVGAVLWRNGNRTAGATVLVLTLTFSAVVGFGRMVHGAHFLSDVLASMATGILLTPASVALGFRYRRQFDR